MNDPLATLLGLGGPAPQDNPQPVDNAYRWATVIALGPLMIQFDGDTAPIAGRPDSLVSDLEVDDRVWCQLYKRRVIVLGVGYAL